MLRLVILAISLLTGGAAAWLAYSLIGSEPAPVPEQVVESVPTSDVLIAAAPVGRGEPLGPQNLEWTPWPERAVGDGMILRESQPDAVDSYTGWVSRSALLPGDPIRAERLVEGHGGLMALMLTPGMRAVAVRVSAESGAGGFIMPEDRVDILHTMVRDADGDGTPEPVSSTIIRDVRVLAVDQVVQQNEADATARVAETATLELSPAQVERLMASGNSGQVSLALRPVGEPGEISSGEAVDGEPTLAVSDLLPPEEQPPAPAPTSPEEQPPAPAPTSPEEQPPAPAPTSEESPDEQSPALQRRMLDVRIIGSGQVETVQVPDDG